MIKYFILPSFLILVVLLVNGCAIAGQRAHVTVYPNSNFDYDKYTQFYSYYSGDSPSTVMFVIDQYLEYLMKNTVNGTKSVDKLLVAYEGKKGVVFPPYFSHFNLHFTSMNYSKVMVLDSMTKQPIMKCIYTRGFFALAGGGNYQTIMNQSLHEGFEKLEDIKEEKEKNPKKKILDEITFTVD